jgi:hypothetical protein
MEEVSFQTADGWTLYGSLWTPGGLSESARVPGVALLHSSLTDRHIFDHLAELMVKKGLAALSIDCRGRGKSINKAGITAYWKKSAQKANWTPRQPSNFWQLN